MGVSVHINIGADDEAKMLEDLGKVAVECMEWEYRFSHDVSRGAKIKSENDVEVVSMRLESGQSWARHCQVPYTGSPDSFREVVAGCPVPVVIAGGSKLSDEETLKMIDGAMKAGAAGFHGRNAFSTRKTRR